MLLVTDDYTVVQYVTHRLRLRLPAGRAYGMSMPSSDYAMRIYLDGEELGSVGVPGATREDAVPRVDLRTYYFVPQAEEVTLLVQTSNFVHRDGCYPPNISIGLSENVHRLAQKELIQRVLVLGGLAAASLYFLALFALNWRQHTALIFAACCALMALMNKQLVPMFFPEYHWHAAFQLEYLVHFATFGMVVLLIHRLFPGSLHRLVVWVYLGLCGVYALSTFVLDTRVYSGLLFGFEGASGVMILYVLARLALRLKKARLQNLLGFVGLLVLGVLAINDLLHHHITIPALGGVTILAFAAPGFTAPPGMLFFTLCYALIVSLDFAEAQSRMEDARRQYREAEARHAALEERLRAEADARAEVHPPTLGDFGLSSREKEVAVLLIDGKSREEIATLLGVAIGTVNTLCTRLYRKAGIKNATELKHKLERA